MLYLLKKLIWKIKRWWYWKYVAVPIKGEHRIIPGGGRPLGQQTSHAEYAERHLEMLCNSGSVDIEKVRQHPLLTTPMFTLNMLNAASSIAPRTTNQERKDAAQAQEETRSA